MLVYLLYSFLEEKILKKHLLFISRFVKEFSCDCGKIHNTQVDDVIVEKWDDILAIIEEELPSSEQIDKIMSDIEAPKTPEEIGLGDTNLAITFKATKDIRDKYVLSRLAWDLGVIEEIKY